jgi:hypothetical protein
MSVLYVVHKLSMVVAVLGRGVVDEDGIYIFEIPRYGTADITLLQYMYALS